MSTICSVSCNSAASALISGRSTGSTLLRDVGGSGREERDRGHHDQDEEDDQGSEDDTTSHGLQSFRRGSHGL